MLKLLSIANYALIEKVEIPFYEGFSVITGETGAGKSIMLGALGLVLGQRADASVLRNKEQKCVVEAEFDIIGYSLKELFVQNDLDFEPVLLIRREILPNGKSRAFINDTPVGLSVLKEIVSNLIDIHSQHQTLLLGENHFQLGVVDAVANALSEKSAYVEAFGVYKILMSKLSVYEADNIRMKDELDFISFQYQQLVDAKLVENEQVDLENRLKELTHANDIKQAMLSSVDVINGDQVSLLSQLKDVHNHMAKILSFLVDGDAILERIDNAYLDLKDLVADLALRAEKVNNDPNELEKVQNRLGLIFELQQKHRVSSIEQLIALREEFGSRLTHINGLDQAITDLKIQIGKQRELLLQNANALTAKRKSSFQRIGQSITSQLANLGMPSSKFEVTHSLKTDFGADGFDDILFLFSANKSGQLSELEKVASGGEMSRLMLCIKSLLSEVKGLPTLILDEIDTGVSGEIAHKMGAIMAQMSANMQVISITHLPQIASRGKKHYRVEKVDKGSHHATNIVQIENNERVNEIAKMLSGSELSNAALLNARELLGM